MKMNSQRILNNGDNVMTILQPTFSNKLVQFISDP